MSNGVEDSAFAATQAALPVSLIATPRNQLCVCAPCDRIADVALRFPDFDHIPVTEDGTTNGRVLGLLDIHRLRTEQAGRPVTDLFSPLAEAHLIGSDASIIDFIREATHSECKLLVSGKSISGLVTISDLQELPVRAALFALLTQLELTMAERIRQVYDNPRSWTEKLSPDRRAKILAQITESKDSEVFLDELLFTQFADKVTLLAKAGNLGTGRRKFEQQLAAAQKLRDALAHANEYASTRTRALEVSQTVQKVLTWIDRLR